jgi:uncharacterized SAM-binding protein YcdF (DUF218 family)
MFKAIKWLIALNVIGIVVFIGYNANGVWVSSKLDQREQTEAIIVLGAAQFDGFPSPVYRNRLDKALELYEIGVSPLIITVGGKQPKDRFTEAEAGMKYLLSVNNKVSIDPVARGKNTLESLKYVRDEFPELRKVTLVSDPIHLWRSKIISKSLDFEVRLAANSSGPGTIFESNNFIKELAASVYFTINKYSSSFIDKSRIYNIKS